MTDPSLFFEHIKQKGGGIFVGVPDSLLKHFCAVMDSVCKKDEHIIAANEGNAIAIAAGYYLATGKPGVVYLQNSGLGNCVNPLASLADTGVYGIPMLLVIGWRGETGVVDEPQHFRQGRITIGQLDLLDIPHYILGPETDPILLLDKAFSAMEYRHGPVGIVVRKDTFCPDRTITSKREFGYMRESAISKLLTVIEPNDLIVSSTGKASRELYEIRESRGEGQRDFLTVGSMGHASSIALGVSVGKSHRRVICLDGDGALLMHLGSIAVIGSVKPCNFVHVLLNNGVHDSVGGQPTVARDVDFSVVSVAFGYEKYYLAYDDVSLCESWQNVCRNRGPQFLEIRISPGSRDQLSRPTTTPKQNKQCFMSACIGDVF